MRNKKRRMEFFSFYNHTSITAHLEKMARKGWLLEEKEDFYLQEDGTVVVVFDKYEIAAGAAGVLEFPIGKLPQA